jgi:holo-[acyl-carrier protein] synthase
MKEISIGCDIEDINRFARIDLFKHSIFLERVFSKKEISYCFSKSNPAPSLAVRFSAKEATIKALSDMGICGLDYKDIEIYNDKTGAPKLSIKGLEGYKAKVSLSHSKSSAIASVIIFK